MTATILNTRQAISPSVLNIEFKTSFASDNVKGLSYNLTATSDHVSGIKCDCLGYKNYSRCKHVERLSYILPVLSDYVYQVVSLVNKMNDGVLIRDMLLHYMKVVYVLIPTDDIFSRDIINKYRNWTFKSIILKLKDLGIEVK